MACCSAKCGVLSSSIIILIVGGLFLAMGGVVVSFINSAIASGIAHGVSIRYNIDWNVTQQQDFLSYIDYYTYYGFNITNLAAARSGSQLINVAQTGPYNLIEYDYRYNLTFYNTPDGAVASSNLWWFDTNLTAADGAFYTDQITTVNPAYLGFIYGPYLPPLTPGPLPVGELSLFALGSYAIFQNLLSSYTDPNGKIIFSFQVLSFPYYVKYYPTGTAALVANFSASVPCSTADAANLLGISNPYSLVNSTSTWLYAMGGNTTDVGILVGAFNNNLTLVTATLQYVAQLVKTSTYASIVLNVYAASPAFFDLSSNLSWSSIGLIQYGRSTMTLGSSGSYTVYPSGPGYSPLSSVWKGPELSGYNILNTATLNITTITLFLNTLSVASTTGGLCTYFNIYGSSSLINSTLYPILGPFNATAMGYYMCQTLVGYVGLDNFEALNGGLFTTRPLSDVVYGYPNTTTRNDPVLELVGKTYPGLSSSFSNQSDGLYHIPGPYTFFTGVDNGGTKGYRYYAWRNQTSLTTLYDVGNPNTYSSSQSNCLVVWKSATNCPLWQSTEVITGLSGSEYLGPRLDKDPVGAYRVLNIWSTDLLRSVNFTYNSTVFVKNISARHYVLDPASLHNQNLNPVNAKYYMTVEGLAPMSVSAANVPLFLSRPHFYSTSSADNIQSRITGLNVGLSQSDVESLYYTYINVEPITGIAMNGSKKLQISLALDASVYAPGFRYSKLFNLSATQNYIYVPIFWADEHNFINDTQAVDLANALYSITTASTLGDNLQISGYVIGSVLCAIGLVLLGYYFKLRSSEGTSTLKSSAELFTKPQ